jgi:hypothetical protein
MSTDEPTPEELARCTRKVRSYIAHLEKTLGEARARITELSSTGAPTNTQAEGYSIQPDLMLSQDETVNFWPAHPDNEKEYRKFRRHVSVKAEDDHVVILGHPALRIVPSSVNSVHVYPLRSEE